MSQPKTQLALLFGGQSPEHEVSVKSARNIFAAIPKGKYEVVLIGLSKTGRWYELTASQLQSEDIVKEGLGKPLAIIPGAKENQIIYLIEEDKTFPQLKVIFPITHGPYGEDGTLQGLFRHLSLPFVGPDLLGSAVCMDKDVCKRLLREADLMTAEYFCFHYYEKDAIDYTAVINRLGSTLFIKPANMGSSVGVQKTTDHESFQAAVTEAFRYDHKIIVEEAITGRELECAVLGNGAIGSTSVGEVAMSDETDSGLYDYESKYISATAANILIPAPDIDGATLAKLRSVAQQAYLVLGCEGMSRVDMFLTDDGQVYVNEVNTLPGFTNISMYPKLWEHAGTAYSDLIDNLVQLALERGKRESQLEKSL